MHEVTIQRLLEEFEQTEKRRKVKSIKPYSVKPSFTLVRFIIWKGKKYRVGIARDSKDSFTVSITRGER